MEDDNAGSRRVKRKNSGIEFAESDDESVIESDFGDEDDFVEESADERCLDGAYDHELPPPPLTTDDDMLLIPEDDKNGSGIEGPGFSSGPAIVAPPI